MATDVGVLEQGRALLAEMAAKHLPGQHVQQSHAGDGVPGVDAAMDKLKLAGRIQLGDGERLVASDAFRAKDGSILPAALTRTPDGPRLRLGLGVGSEDRKRWAGRNLGSTVNLDRDGMQRLRSALAEMRERGAEGGSRFRALEVRADELDELRRDILLRQYAGLSKTDRAKLKKLDRRLEEIDREVAWKERALQNTAEYLAEEEPEKRARWDEIEAAIAQLDPERDRDRIESLQDEQARLSLSPSTWMAPREIRRLREQRQDLEAERQVLTANAAPLSPADRVELASTDAEIASTQAEIDQMVEVDLAEGVIPSLWGGLAYQAATHETTYDYDDLGVYYRIGVRPHDAGEDWYLGSEETYTDLRASELPKLERWLDEFLGALGGNDVKSVAQATSGSDNSGGAVRSRNGRLKHLPGGHNQQSHAGDDIDVPDLDDIGSIDSGIDVLATRTVRVGGDSYHLASLLDRGGGLGRPGERFVALSQQPFDGSGELAVHVRAREVGEFADKLEELAARSRVKTPPADEDIGGVLVGRASVGGVEMAAYHDWGGDLAGEGDGLVALAYNGDYVAPEVEWDYMLDIGTYVEMLDAKSVDRLAAVMRELATEGPAHRRTSAKTRGSMSTKSFRPTFKNVSDQGEVTFVVATLNEVDKDGDVTLPGYFGRQHVHVVPAHQWEHVWLGKGVIYEQGNEALCQVKFNLKIPAAKDWYEAIKFDYENPPALAEYSYGFDVLEGGSKDGYHQGRQVRYLKPKDDGSPGVKVHEVSPLILGAGVGTRTVGVKSQSRSGRRQMPDRPLGRRAVKGAIPSHDTATVARAWDGPKTEASLPDDARPSQLRTVYAWVDYDGDPEAKSSYKFPHHHGIGGPANIRACLAGIAVLNGARGGTSTPEADHQAVYKHLAAHLRDADREPPELMTGPGSKNLRFGDEAAMVLASVGGLIDRASEVMVLRQRKGKGMSASTADLLSWVGDELTRLKHLLSQPVEPEIAQPSDDEIASLVAASMARIHGM